MCGFYFLLTFLSDNQTFIDVGAFVGFAVTSAVIVILIIIVIVTCCLVYLKTHRRKMPGQYKALLV